MDSVHFPDSPVESRCKAHPCAVGRHHPRRWRADPPERDGSCHDRHQHHQYFRQCESWLVHSKEEWRPRKVERQLHGKECQWHAHGGLLAASPDGPCGHRHECVEQGPCWPEQPSGRRPGGLCKCGVPIAGRGRQAAGCAASDADDECQDEVQVAQFSVGDGLRRDQLRQRTRGRQVRGLGLLLCTFVGLPFESRTSTRSALMRPVCAYSSTWSLCQMPWSGHRC